ncbi:hypothetical protein MKZ38_007164 [Zalerion maritima]|uniref:Uncharacterized protein n=1 Tax=Zalerion maritima TaxID=339359 RepID=A0AAD5WVL6_9PEZI|nr:hypothetical protein MKZ38_007164 [Zalerion maritima]
MGPSGAAFNSRLPGLSGLVHFVPFPPSLRPPPLPCCCWLRGRNSASRCAAAPDPGAPPREGGKKRRGQTCQKGLGPVQSGSRPPFRGILGQEPELVSYIENRLMSPPPWIAEKTRLFKWRGGHVKARSTAASLEQKSRDDFGSREEVEKVTELADSIVGDAKTTGGGAQSLMLMYQISCVMYREVLISGNPAAKAADGHEPIGRAPFLPSNRPDLNMTHARAACFKVSPGFETLPFHVWPGAGKNEWYHNMLGPAWRTKIGMPLVLGKAYNPGNESRAVFER